MTTYKIPAENFDKLVEKISKVTRKAEKLGLFVPILNKLREYNEPIDGSPTKFRTFFDVSIDSERISINGYDFVAKICVEDDERVISRVPGVMEDTPLPAKFREATDDCEHCGLRRKRNDVFILYHSGEDRWMQIGRNCLSLFLGGVDPENVVKMMEILFDMQNVCASNTGFSGHFQPVLDAEDVLNFTEFVIAKQGWVSKSKSQELADKDIFVQPTASIVYDAYYGTYMRDRLLGAQLLAEFEKLNPARGQNNTNRVSDALAWIRNIDVSTEGDYLYNLYTICRSDFVKAKHLGTLVSLFAAFDRATKPKMAMEAKKPSEWVGKVGDKHTFSAKVTKILFWHNNFGGTHPVFFEDENGNVVVWKSSKEVDLQVGSTYEFTAKIKKHSEFNGKKQTEVSHAKILGAIGAFSA